MRARRSLPLASLVALLLVTALPPLLMPSAAALSCEPAPRPAVDPATQAGVTPPPAAAVPAEATKLKVGLVPVAIFAPVFVALDKGYYAEQGLDVTLESLAGGSDLVTLTATGELQVTAAGAGPAFWNAMALGLPLTVIAPGHQEGAPVATPLMISKASCESGAISGVADLAGKRVSVNARGATEYWLSQALSTGGLTLDDVDLQTLAFPDAVVALGEGALDAAMVGEPLATKAEQDGIAVRLATDFPIQDVLPTVILANSDFAAANPEAVAGFVTAYLKAARDLSGSGPGEGFADPLDLAIIERYTKVPAALAGSAVPPVYSTDGAIDPDALGKLQTFFRERGQLEYDVDLVPADLIDSSYVEVAMAELGPWTGE